MDISKLQEKLQELNSRSGGSGSSIGYININDGRNLVRILPAKSDSEMFYKETWVHYGVGKSDTNKKGAMVICPKTHGDDKPCPVCKKSDMLFKQSKAKDDFYSKQAREVRKKKRVYYNAISRDDDITAYTKDADGNWKDPDGKEGSPVKVMSSGIGVFKDLLKIIVDPEYGDITDPEEGLDVIITKTGTGFDTDYDVKTVRKESPIGFDEWEELLFDLNLLAKSKTYDEIVSIMEGTDSDDDDDEDDDEDATETPVEGVENTDAPPSDDASAGSIDDDIKAALDRRRNKK